jgi:hypothetical protein
MLFLMRRKRIMMVMLSYDLFFLSPSHFISSSHLIISSLIIQPPLVSALVKGLAEVDQKQYPETLGQLFIINW